MKIRILSKGLHVAENGVVREIKAGEVYPQEFASEAEIHPALGEWEIVEAKKAAKPKGKDSGESDGGE